MSDDKQQWVERTLDSLEGGFDKKQLLAEVDRFDDAELRSIIATSLTGSMAKRKLEQYKNRMGAGDDHAKPDASDKPANAPRPVTPAEPGSEKPQRSRSPASIAAEPSPESEPAEPSERSDDHVDFTEEPEPLAKTPKRRAPPTPEPDEPEPVLPEPSEKPPEPSPEQHPKDIGSADRFDKLEQTLLASKSKADLSVPDLPDGMLDSIRQLKDLTRSKIREPSKPAHKPTPPPVRSDELLDALDGLAAPSTTGDDRSEASVQTAEPASAEPEQSRPQTPQRTQPSSDQEAPAAKATLPEQGERNQLEADAETTALFDEFLEHDASTSEAQPQAQPRAEPAKPPVEPGSKPAAPQPEPLAPTRSRSASDTETVEHVDAARSDDELAAFDEFFESGAPGSETEVPASPEPVTPEPEAPASEPEKTAAPDAERSAAPASERSSARSSIDAISKRFTSLLGTMTAVNQELPHPDAPETPVAPEQPEPQKRSAYDGSWIEACESIGDVLDVLETVEGSIEDVRSTIALFVLPVSDDLAQTIRTAKNRDELELMLRRALTVTIDDAFERTKQRFEQEQETLEREAVQAATSFDDAVRQAVETHREELAPETNDVAHSIENVYEAVEAESADDVSEPVPRPEPKREPTVSEQIHAMIASIHEEVEQGRFDKATEHVKTARTLLSRQMRIKESRGDPIVDEKMADFELKALALDLDILETRQ